MEKSLPELTQEVESLEAKINTLTEKQKDFIEVWCCAVARIYEAPFVPSYLNYPGSQILEFTEYYLCPPPSGLSNRSEKTYYYEEKLEILHRIDTKGLDVLQQYQLMVESLKAYVEKEAQNTLVWDRWDGDYATRKVAKWVREWKQRFLEETE